MNCSNASEPGESDANATGDAAANALAKIQGIGEVDSGELDDGNIVLGSFVIALPGNLWDSI